MKSSPELLTEILGVLGKINSNIEFIRANTINSKDTFMPGGKASSKEEKDKAKTAFGGFDVNDFSQEKKSTEKLRDTANSIKILSESLIPFSSSLITFSLIPKTAKKSLIEFLRELLTQSNISGSVDAAVAAKTVAEAIGILSDAIPKLGKATFNFGMMQKMGFVSSTTKGIKELIKVLTPSRKADGYLSVDAAKTASESIGILSNALPKLAKGVFIFGTTAKLGLVHLTALGLTELLGVMTT
jgi:hypothetical protein